MKKFLFLTWISLMLLIQNPLSILAQDSNALFNSDQQPQIVDVEGLRAEFKQYTQNPDSKVVRFEMTLKSNIDSDRLKITWELKGVSSFVDETKKIVYGAVKKGESYVVPIEIIPRSYGVTELYGKVEAFKAENSYLVTVRKNFASNENAEVLPITDEFNSAKNLSLVKNIGFAIVGFTILVIFGLFGFKKFKNWLNKDERIR
jgi:hypothetical protein